MASIREGIRRVTQAGPPPFTCSVIVESVHTLSEGFCRVAVCSDELTKYRRPLPADAFKVLLPPDGAGAVDFPSRGDDGLPFWPDGSRRPVLRPYTVRRFDPVWLRLEFDIAVHGSGLAMTWLRNLQRGDVIGLAGMRHEWHPGDGVDRHLIVGDASALPAVAAIIDTLDPSVEATVYLAVEHDSDRKLLPQRDNVTAHWVVDSAQSGADSALARAVRAGEREGGRAQAWLAAEAGVVRDLRRFALGELGVAHRDLRAAAYWKAGTDSTEVDALNLARYQQAAADGADITDPDVIDAMEFAD